MNRHALRTAARCVAPAIAATLLVAWSSVAHADNYGGRGCGAQSGPTRYCDTGPLPPGGGSLQANESAIVAGILSTGPAHSTCEGANGTSHSTASVNAVVVTRLLVQILTCSALSSQSTASCDGLTGSSTISSLVFAGVAVTVTGQANQVVSVPGVGTLTINEKIMTSTSIRVNALHLVLVTGEDLILGGCESSYLCALGVEGDDSWSQVKALYR